MSKLTAHADGVVKTEALGTDRLAEMKSEVAALNTAIGALALNVANTPESQAQFETLVGMVGKMTAEIAEAEGLADDVARRATVTAAPTVYKI